MSNNNYRKHRFDDLEDLEKSNTDTLNNKSKDDLLNDFLGGYSDNYDSSAEENKTSEFNTTKKSVPTEYDDLTFDRYGADNQQQTDNKGSEYGDEFDSQTGESSSQNTQADQNSNSNNYQNRASQKNKKTSNNKLVGILLTCGAVLFLIIAIIFAVTQCKGGTSDKKTTTAPTTKAIATTIATTKATTTQATTERIVETTTQEATKAPETTTKPNETTKPTELPTTEPVTTEQATTIPPQPTAEPATEEPSTVISDEPAFQPIESIL